MSPTASKLASLALIRPIADTIAQLPSTRYYGSKRKLLPWIYDHIRTLEFDTVLDALGGTASVSLLFKAMRKTVTYHDGFRFNLDVANTLLSNNVAMDRSDVVQFLANVTPTSGVVARSFRGIYYKNAENAWIDGYVASLQQKRLTRARSALLRYLLYQACLKKRPFNLFHRANLHLRTNKGVARSFGNHVTWERSFQHHILQAYDDLPSNLLADTPHKVLQPGNVERLKPGYDLVYIDPPYVNNISRYNRDDYWRRYHFLEGLANYDSWEQRIDYASDIRLLERPKWMLDWATKRSFQERLFSFIYSHKESQVVLSYVTGAHPDQQEIVRFFEDTFSNVSVHSRDHNHALGATPRRELLFIGRP
ncbi:DNA adenine methylase [Bradyrhizobium sp.]|uniref:DNA adenine methylase n=1 Tax=Bradyrhizobium sp. TaxID=376 RepID=UPI0039E6A91F